MPKNAKPGCNPFGHRGLNIEKEREDMSREIQEVDAAIGMQGYAQQFPLGAHGRESILFF